MTVADNTGGRGRLPHHGQALPRITRVDVSPSAVHGRPGAAERPARTTTGGVALRIVDATGPGPNATRTRTEFLPDAAHDLDVERRYLRVLGGEGARLGHWHTHSAGSGTPSPADLQAWHTWCEMLDDARSVGVIVTPDRDRGWHRPHLDGWVLQRRDDGLCSICRPVALEVRR